MKTLILAFFLLTSFFFPVFAQQNTGPVNYFGQIRSGYYGTYTYHNDQNNHEWRTRIRLGFGYQFSESLDFKMRFAGQYSTDQDKFRFWLNDHLPTRSGMRRGDTTIDMFEANWTATDNLSFTFGRFQSNYSLRSGVTKGLHRYDNPNMLISWTDGIKMSWVFTPDWQLDYIAEYNAENGAGSIVLSPLGFSEPASRISHTVIFLDKKKPGNWLQREAGVHIIPSSFQKSGDYKPYIAYTTRLSVGIPQINWKNGYYYIGTELGFAPFVPETNLDFSRNNAFAGQLVFSVRNFMEHYNLGILYGYADPGWLISPSLRPNSHTYEARVQRRFSKSLTAEIRYRQRTDPYNSDGRVSRNDGDIWSRFTWNF